MAQYSSKNKSKDNAAYSKLKAALKTGKLEKCYVFFGEEQYLLRDSLTSLRALLCPDGLDSFNFKRFDNHNISIEELENAVETLPVFAEKTMIEVHDYDIFSSAHRERIGEIFANLPDYVCLLLVYTVIEYKPDGRLKTTKELLKHIETVEFCLQEQSKLVSWIRVHFRELGKNCSVDDTEYLAFITGGSMTALYGEIRKVAAYSQGESVSRSDIDAVVVPVLDTMVYMLTDAIVKRDRAKTVQILDELLQMREVPHKLLYSISMKMRQLLAARVCIERKIGEAEFKETAGIYYGMQARTLLDTARKTTLVNCRDKVLMCSQSAIELNSTQEPEARITELVTRLSM